MNRTTPEIVTKLNNGQVFVFGSNLAGRHGKGAAKTAIKWGAIYGNPIGLQGNTYAIPTKDRLIKRTLNLNEIKPYVDAFILFAKDHPHLEFLVTPIGCGLAGLNPKRVASLFYDAVKLTNVFLPDSFWKYIPSAIYTEKNNPKANNNEQN